jgi:hypothetical protein
VRPAAGFSDVVVRDPILRDLFRDLFKDKDVAIARRPFVSFWVLHCHLGAAEAIRRLLLLRCDAALETCPSGKASFRSAAP